MTIKPAPIICIPNVPVTRAHHICTSRGLGGIIVERSGVTVMTMWAGWWT